MNNASGNMFRLVLFNPQIIDSDCGYMICVVLAIP